MPDVPSKEPRPWCIQMVPSEAKGTGTRSRAGDTVQCILWGEEVRPGDQLPTGMKMEMKAGIAAASLGQGLTGLSWAETGSWAMAGVKGSPSRGLLVPSGP